MVKNVASVPARSSARAVARATPRLARKIALAPMPVSTPPARNRARLGGAVQADRTRTARPRTIGGIPAARRRRDGHFAVVTAPSGVTEPRLGAGWCAAGPRRPPAVTDLRLAIQSCSGDRDRRNGLGHRRRPPRAAAAAGCRRERHEPPPEAGLDAARERERSGDVNPPAARRAARPRGSPEGERVPARPATIRSRDALGDRARVTDRRARAGVATSSPCSAAPGGPRSSGAHRSAARRTRAPPARPGAGAGPTSTPGGGSSSHRKVADHAGAAARGVHGVHDRDRERRQVLLPLVETVERARGGRQRRDDQERERDRPEAHSPGQPQQGGGGRRRAGERWRCADSCIVGPQRSCVTDEATALGVLGRTPGRIPGGASGLRRARRGRRTRPRPRRRRAGSASRTALARARPGRPPPATAARSRPPRSRGGSASRTPAPASRGPGRSG